MMDYKYIRVESTMQLGYLCSVIYSVQVYKCLILI